MPVANIWETIFIIGLVALGAFLYVKTKNFFVAMVAVIVMTWVGADRELCQWELLYIEATLAAAVFAVERVFG
jgi:Ca2+/Na+ antiporter